MWRAVVSGVISVLAGYFTVYGTLFIVAPMGGSVLKLTALPQILFPSLIVAVVIQQWLTKKMGW